jgi:hypothetical protein
MGECGCGDREPSYWMPGPEGFFYTVALFETVCASCDGPPGMRVDMWPEVYRESLLEGVPSLCEGSHKLDGRFIEFPRSRKRHGGRG